jgi:hypothetical protein
VVVRERMRSAGRADEANKMELEKETNMPFDSWMDFTTVTRYVELLLFVFRAEEDEPEFRPPYVLTCEQTAAMQVVRDKIEEFQASKKEQEKTGEGEGENERDEGFDEERVRRESGCGGQKCGGFGNRHRRHQGGCARRNATGFGQLRPGERTGGKRWVAQRGDCIITSRVSQATIRD